MLKKTITTSLFSIFIVSVFAYLPPNKEAGIKQEQSNKIGKKANCAPSTGKMFLEYNNVKCIIETAGFMWTDRSTGISSYEVPKGGGRFVIYAGALWMGGTTSGGILKVAAHEFRQGNDFWAGPLTTNLEGDGVNTIAHGDGQIDPATCNLYDRFWVTTRNEAASHYFCKAENICPEEGYTTPESIRNWPGNYVDDGSKYVDFFLAPFVDVNSDNFYNAEDGDYPGYDLFKQNACPKPRGGRVDLFGDYNIWYVFNDRGNIHTETGGDDIGMEVKAQAFAFSTSDEVNSMTFYNYELINRSTTTLTNTYFGQFVDGDLGCYADDYAGCDVQRGFGYIYNGQAVDGSGGVGCQGIPWNDGTPPAIGVDFFEGPYQDNDGVDNPLTTDVQRAILEKGIPYKGIGLGYGDGVADNERFGMSRFVYFNGSGAPIGAVSDPVNAIEFYNYMQGVWRDGSSFVHGGFGHVSSGGSVPTKYVFPGDSDPLFWGTEGVTVSTDWTEQTAGNVSGDRRFFQSAGPFTLEPGALNNITVGVVYARAGGGDPFQSVELVRLADDKAQKLFDNCFRLIDGPDAPEVDVRELDREIVFYLTNLTGISNNYVNNNEDYQEVDPNINLDSYRIYLDTVPVTGKPWADPNGTGADVSGTGICEECYYKDDNIYRFQGYQIYQLSGPDVGAEELDDINKSRIIAQVDVKDGVKRLINFEFDADLGAPIPIEKVDGEDKGISHTFKITTDAFAQGDNRLVNYKKYYYMAVSYAYNNYRDYNPTDPLFLDGQQKPYLRGRKAALGPIPLITVIPHKPLAGTVINSQYGSTPMIIREEGRGNGGLEVDLTIESENEILDKGFAKRAQYEKGAIPVDIKVIDPLKVPNDEFELRFFPDYGNAFADAVIYNSRWALISKTTKDTVWSDTTISYKNEQILLNSKASKFNSFGEYVDIDWGFSISISTPLKKVGNQFQIDRFPTLLSASITYSDTTKPWLGGISDNDGVIEYDWIRSGTVEETDPPTCFNQNDILGEDPDEIFEGVLSGIIAPFPVVSSGECYGEPLSTALESTRNAAVISNTPSIDIVFTDDETKWTRCAVVELQNETTLSADKVSKLSLRTSPSVGKDGNPDNSGTNGLSWFPGYAIDVSTGERMNMAFGEDTWLGAHNGNDMMWNPTSDVLNYGGKHYIYIFRNNSYESLTGDGMPYYDRAEYMYNKLKAGQADKVWASCAWVMQPLLRTGQELLVTDARIRIRVAASYNRFSTDFGGGQSLSNTSTSSNNWYPLYSFSSAELAAEENNLDSAKSALDLINVVPNPYYAYSEYEETRLQNKVKIINLPETCTIKIFNVGGNLIRTFKKDSEVTYVEWDLNNHRNVPISSGMYIIHIDVPGVGEKVLKWMGIMRTPDLENL